VSILIFQSFSIKVEKMTSQQSKLIFSNRRLENVSPDALIKSFWVSSAIALIMTLPPLGIFLAFHYNDGNILVGTVVGFGLHFVLLALSERISNALSRLFDD
jgi:membrane-bound ClpP family serine protease